MKTLLFVAVVCFSGGTALCQRAAFLIGINNYPANVGPLSNCINDVDSMRVILREFGFKVFEATNVSNQQVHDSLKVWFDTMQNYEDVLVYFSGHGFAISGNNFLAPNDYVPTSVNVEDLTVHLYYLMDNFHAIETKPNSVLKNKIILLDACREFPPDDLLKRIKDHLSLKGLKPTESDNLFVGFANLAGATASQNGVHNSLFTQALVENLKMHSTEEIFQLMEDVKVRLEDISHHKQIVLLGTVSLLYYQFRRQPPCWGCFASPGPTHACGSCNDRELGSMFPSEMVGRSFSWLKESSPPESLHLLKNAAFTRTTYSSPLMSSILAGTVSVFLKSRGMDPKSYDLDSSFVVYEFFGENLWSTYVFIKYNSLDFHRRLAGRFGINLTEFPLLVYMHSGRLNTGGLFGRLPEYDYTVLGTAGSGSLYYAPMDLKKYYAIYDELNIPLKPEYRGLFDYKNYFKTAAGSARK